MIMQMKRCFTRTIIILCLLFITAISILWHPSGVFADSPVIYSLVIRNVTPQIKPGDTLEIIVLFSGFGIPLQNKLYIAWSSNSVIEQSNPGYYTVGNGQPVGIDPNGLMVDFDNNLFSITTGGSGKYPPDYGFPLVVGETSLNNQYPIVLTINTSKKAPPGDYDITFVFTYSDNQNIYQDFKTTPFHISSTWERNQLKFQIAAVSIALASLLLVATFNVLRYIKKD